MKKLIAFAAITCLTTSPALATVRDAAYSSSADHAQVRTGLFTGASFSIAFDRKANAPRGRASLKLSGMSYQPARSELRFGQGIEIATGRTGRPALLVGGSDADEIQKSLRLSGGATVAIAVVGVAVIAAGIFAATYCDSHCENRKAE